MKREPATGAARFDPSSRSLLTHRDLGRFPSASLFDRIGRVLCEAGCLPRKELFESWEFARRTRRRFRGGRVVDLACGHGLVGQLMLLLDDSSPSVLAVDRVLPPSANTVAHALEVAWPRLSGRVSRVQAALNEVAVTADDLVVSCHACGALTDVVLARAIEVRARVVVLPCCHDAATCDVGELGGWLDEALAIDVTRAARLRASGYRVVTQIIPASITPKNRLLMAEPRMTPASPSES
ncbi:MAG: methyltransferase [Deltaproteobacteria bacterium]|nr:methyltransferase [Deltaproteobacteria bacterium]